LEFCESHLAAAFVGISLADIEFYHRLRNQLYHQGNGLTVVRQMVVVYATLADQLLERLFGGDEPDKNSRGSDALGRSLDVWLKLERALEERLGPLSSLDPRRRIDEPSILALYLKARTLRNQLVHGQREASEADVENLAIWSKQISTWLHALPGDVNPRQSPGLADAELLGA
jgi:hypothetical protein